jgi:hypothetical protein
MMGELLSLADRFGAIKFYKAHRYGPIYERLFEERQSLVANVVEIGVEFGHSAKVWLEYFPNAHLWGIENNKDLLAGAIQRVASDRFHPILADQSSMSWWDQIPDGVDIVIDDASHYPWDQIATLNNGFSKVRGHGWWIIEDCQTSFMPMYSPGGLGIFGEVFNRIIELQVFGYGGGDFYEARKEHRAHMSELGRMTYGIQVYKSLVVLERASDRSSQEEGNG